MSESIDVPTTLGQVHVEVDGTGPALTMWPSLLMTGDLWSGQVRHFSSRFTTIAIDPPGHGRSARLTRRFSFEECAATIADVLDHLGIERTHYIGNSWGGMIGGTFAALHADRVGCAVLMNATATPAPRRQRLEFGALLAAARALGGIRGPLIPSVVKAFLGPTTLAERPDVVAHVKRVARANDVRSVSYAVRSVVPDRPDQRPLFEQIGTPVLVVAGEEDATFPPPEAEEMARSIPGSELVVLPGAAHLAALEVPETVNDLVERFLADHN